MPSLSDTLNQLATNSTQIHNYSQCNRRQAGPYTTAYLHSLVLPDLIRDGTDPERRSFGFIGEGSDNVKKVEKRDGPVTPLKELARGGRGGVEEIEVVLRTAARVIDDYKPMPKARKHISVLAEQHEKQSRKIEELERLIAELSNSTSKAATPSSPAPSSPKAMMNIDEAIAAEEASLRAIEAYLKPHREIAPQLIERQISPQKSPIKPLQESPIRAGRQSIFTQTPGKTPIREYPHISNSLVNQSERTVINRFTPLKNIGTPQKRERGSIFGRAAPRSVRTGRSLMGSLKAVEQIKLASPTKEVVEEDDTVQVPILGEVLPVSQIPPEEEEAQQEEEEESGGPTPQASPVKVPSPVKARGPRTVHGVLVDDEGVSDAIVKIKSTYPDLLGESSTTDEAINHLYTNSISSPDPTPSDTSSIASTASINTTPITKEQISFSTIFLIVLRSPDLLVPMNEFKTIFGDIIKEKGEGWEDVDAGKMAFRLVAKKVMRFDRSNKAWGAQGALRFAV